MVFFLFFFGLVRWGVVIFGTRGLQRRNRPNAVRRAVAMMSDTLVSLLIRSDAMLAGVPEQWDPPRGT